MFFSILLLKIVRIQFKNCDKKPPTPSLHNSLELLCKRNKFKSPNLSQTHKINIIEKCLLEQVHL